MANANENKVYDIITSRIIEQLEKENSMEWLKTWSNALSKNLITKKSYRGVNIFLLSLLGQRFKSPYYLTFNQVTALKGQVIKGSKSIPIIYYMLKEYTTKDQKGEEVKRGYPILRYYNVFNIEQTTGINPDKIPTTAILNFNPIDKAEEIINGYADKPTIRYGNTGAFYSPSEDYIGMPHKESFTGVEEYYSTLFHELIHSTGHESRLKRPLLANHHRKEYSKEEIIAELGNAFLCGLTGIENKTIDNSTAYIKFWLTQLKEDNKFIFNVCAESQKAVSHITGKSNDQEEATTEQTTESQEQTPATA